MNFLSIFREESRQNTLKLGVVAAFSGIVNGMLVAIILAAAKDAAPDSLNFRNAMLFVLCLSALIISRQYTLNQTGVIAERVIRKLRLRIIDKIRKTDLAFYENLGKSPIYSALTQSAFTLSSSAPAIASSFSAIIMLIFATGYIAFLSGTAFRLTLIFLGLGAGFFFWVRKRVEKELSETTAKESRFFDLLNHHLDGFKALKMHSKRNDDLFENHTLRVANEAEVLKVRTHEELIRMNTFGTTFSYILIAVIVFIIPTWSPDDIPRIPQITAAILFILGPVTEVVSSVAQFFRCNEAVSHIRYIESQLDQAILSTASKDAVPPAEEEFRDLSCEGVTYTYKSPKANGDSFHIGPMDFTIRKGEVVFIVGGNGSGKSTFLKVLTGLYRPLEGLIRLNGKAVAPSELTRYRNLFSPVFTDFHLFDRLYGLQDVDPSQIEELLKDTELLGKTSVVDGRFTSLNLSTGQKKRLALMVAILEEHPILVFDELAADQDPHYRKYFYEVQLQRWKKAGKTVIAVTHDDAYFGVADRVIKMEYGRMIG